MSLAIPDFWKLIIDSRLLAPEQCQHLAGAFSQVKGAAAQSNASTLSEWLISQNVLSRYQSTILLAGRSGPFFYGDYKVYDRIDRGPLTGWFRAVHAPTNHPVLLQFLAGAAAQDPRLWPLVVARVQALRASVHPNLVRCFEAVDQGGFRFLVHEDVRGQSLDEALAANRLPPTEACRQAFLAAGALAHLHQCGQVHGDVRPANVWLEQNGNVKLLCDFTLLPAPINFGQQGPWMAALDYLAPELAMPGKAPDGATDIYAFGCLTYHLLTGRPPFAGGDPAQKFARHAQEPPQPLEAFGLPAPLNQVVGFLVAKQPQGRFPQMALVQQQLAAFVNPAQLQVPPAQPLPSLNAFQSYVLQRAAQPAAPMSPQMAPQVAPAGRAGFPSVKTSPTIAPGGVAGVGPIGAGAASAAGAGVVVAGDSRPKAIADQDKNLVATPQTDEEKKAEKKKMMKVAWWLGGAAAFLILLVVMMNAGRDPAPTNGDSTNTDDTTASTDTSIPKGRQPSTMTDDPTDPFVPKTPPTTTVSTPGTSGTPGTVLPGTTLPGTTLPSTTVPGTTVPGTTSPVSTNPTPVRPGTTPVGTALTQDVVADDGKMLWAAPTSGPAVRLNLVPPGAAFFALLRPASLLGSAEGAKAIKALGPTFDATRADWEKAAGVSWREIETLIVSLHNNNDRFPRSAFVVRLANGQAADLAAKWGTSGPATGPYLKGAGGWCYYVPSDGDGRSFVMGEEPEIQEVAASKGSPPVLRREMSQLLSLADSQRHVHLLFSPHFLFGEGQAMFAGGRAAALRSLEWFLGDWQDIQGCLMSLHCDRDLHIELRLHGNLNKDPYRLADGFRQRLSQIPNDISDTMGRLDVHPYWKQVAFKFPRMIEYLHEQSRVGAEGEHAVINAVLPGVAAHNLLFGGEMLLAHAGGLAAGPATQRPAGTAASGPKSVEDVLNTKMSVKFDQESLEFAMANIAKDVNDSFPGLTPKFEIKILGDDLKLDGITRNQQIRGFDHQNKPLRDILTALVMKANPVTTVKVPTEVDQKLLWVVGPDPADSAKQIVLITTRQVATGKYTLPPEFKAP